MMEGKRVVHRELFLHCLKRALEIEGAGHLEEQGALLRVWVKLFRHSIPWPPNLHCTHRQDRERHTEVGGRDMCSQ